MKTHIKYILLAATSMAMLAGCGGGGSDSPSPGSNVPISTPVASAPTAAGLYLETETNRIQKINFLIQDTLFLGVAGSTDAFGQMYKVDGVLMGIGSSKNGTYSANLQYLVKNKGLSEGTFTGSDSKINSLNGTLTVGGISQPLLANAPSTAAFDYKKPAELKDIVGTWILNLNVIMKISDDGLISGSDGSCSFTGLVAPDVKTNVYVLSITDAKSTACGATGGEVGKGYVVSYLLANGKRQIMMMAQVKSLNAARGFAGVRS